MFIGPCIIVIVEEVNSVLQASATPNLQHTTNREQNYRCGNLTAQSQAPDDGYFNVRNMLST